ncbi:hypothetical protein [Streptomyces sp. NPDC056361]|uniref:hypothetical protein n=1 Tax=Streptomyces sp. NPDC056361 TaxID=3345795 RepID=UPI0035E25DC6
MEQVPYLDWGDSRHFDHTQDRPCSLCGRPTPLRSHAGEPVHKVCAEAWNAACPGEPRRYTVPTKLKPQQHDVGTWRFHNDGPVTDQRVPILGQVITTNTLPGHLTASEQRQGGLFAA